MDRLAPPGMALPPSALPQAAPGAAAPQPGLREAAQGFEAMLLRQFLAAADKVDLGGRDLFGSSAQDSFRELRNAEFARIAAASGTLGLAARIEAQLAGGSATPAAPGAAPEGAGDGL